MKTEPTGAGETRPPAPEGLGRRESLELSFARIPFRVKLALVWLGIFIVLGTVFAMAKFDVSWMQEKAVYISRGLRYTITTAVLAIVLAMVLALLGALGRLSKSPIAFGVTGFYTSFFRGTPLIVQMFLIYSALPEVGKNFEVPLGGSTYVLPEGIKELFLLSSFQAGVLALGLNYGAYMTEIFRAGIQSVGHGQAEAADALGMTYRQKMRRVVLPQAVRVIIPPTGNEFINMLKTSSLVSAVQYTELLRASSNIGSTAGAVMEMLFVASIWYLALTSVFSVGQYYLERRYARGALRTLPPTPLQKIKAKLSSFSNSKAVA